MAEKLLTVGAGENVVRLLPPLNVTEAEIAEAMQRLSQALKRLPKPAVSRLAQTGYPAAMPPRHFLDIDLHRRRHAQAHPRHGARHEEGGQARAGQAQAAPASPTPC